MVDDATIKKCWRGIVTRPGIIAGWTVIWTLWWLIFAHSHWSIGRIEHLIDLCFLAAGSICLFVPILVSRRSFRQFEKRFLALGANEDDLTSLVKSTETLLKTCYIAFFILLLAVIGYTRGVNR